MTRARLAMPAAQRGFTLLELLIAAAVFLIVAELPSRCWVWRRVAIRPTRGCWPAFRKRGWGWIRLSATLNDSGYPPQNYFSVLPGRIFTPPRRSIGAQAIRARHVLSSDMHDPRRF